MADEELREASREQWAGVAQNWAGRAEQRERGPSGAAADWMLSAARLEPGAAVLELACGAGDVGLRAAEAVGPEGRVLCTDFAEPMVAVVRERAAEAGLAHVEARVLDAEEGLGDGERFHVVLCRFGFMLMADPARALRSSLAVLDAGGRLAFAVWGPGQSNPWLSLVTDAVMKTLGAPPPEPGTPGPFALAGHERLRGLLTDAGFADVELEDLESETRHDSLEAWWTSTREVAGPIGALLSQLPKEQVTAIRDHALEHAAVHVQPDGSVRFPARVALGRAVRPA